MKLIIFFGDWLAYMCMTVVLPNGEWLQSIAEIKAQGWETEGFTQAESEDECLCRTDIEAILERAGQSYSQETPGFLDVYKPLNY